MRKLRIGLVGAGFMMQTVHLPYLRNLEDMDIVALAELDRTLGERVAGAFGIPRIYASSAEMAESGAGFDAVVAVTPKEHHATAILPLLERGIPVFTEKPLDATLEGARRLAETSRSKGVPLMVGYMKRFDPAVAEAARLLESGEIGDLRYAHLHDSGGDWTAGAVRVQPLLPGNEAPPPAPRQPIVYPDARAEAFAEWLEVWIHDVNLAQALFGAPGEIVYATNEQPRLAYLRYERAKVLYEVGRLSYPSSPWNEHLTVYGSAGRLELGFLAPLLFRAPTYLAVHTSSGTRLPLVGHMEGFHSEMACFLRCIAAGEWPRPDTDEALRDVELCARIAEAATR